MTASGTAIAARYALRDLSTLEKAVKLCKQKRVALQAGGNLGIWPAFLAQRFEHTVTFEPDPVTFTRLAQHMARHARPDRYTLVQGALGSLPGMVSMSRRRRVASTLPDHPGLTHVLDHVSAEPNGEVFNAMMTRLDDWKLRELDLLALDLEGYEMAALVGAHVTINECRPVILCEISDHATHYGIDQDDVRTNIRMRGYRFVERVHSDEIWEPV